MYSTALSLCLLIFFFFHLILSAVRPLHSVFLSYCIFQHCDFCWILYFLLFLVSVEILTSVIHFPPNLSEHLYDHYLNSLSWKSLLSVSLRSFSGVLCSFVEKHIPQFLFFPLLSELISAKVLKHPHPLS